jgi:F0F1-type ATP synthase membrane subunit b/b'
MLIINEQSFTALFIFIGVFLLLLSFLNLYIIFYVKKLKDKQSFISLKFPEEILNQLAQDIKKETKNTVFETNKKLFNLLISFYEKEIISFTENWNNIMIKFKNSAEKELPEIEKIKSEIQEKILKEIEKEIKELSKNISRNAEQIYQSAAQSINNEITQAQEYIKNYKEKKMKEINKKIYQIINDISKEIIGKSISIREHEDLVIKALEDAKKELI